MAINSPQEGIETPLFASNTIPLCVDLDGSLIKSDTLWEGFWAALRKHPIACLAACIAFLTSRAKFKQRISRLAVADPAHLPYRQDVLAFLRVEADAGRPLFLVTAADESVARQVAGHLKLFGRVIASDGIVNCKGRKKLEAIRQVSGEFLYLGDSTADLAVWRASAGAIVVGGTKHILRKLNQSDVRIYRLFPNRTGRARAITRAIRIHQWPKNLLVFLPVFLGHRMFDPTVWKPALLVFAVFCLTASFNYVVNDLLDLEADRLHIRKRERPFAAGDLSIAAGFWLAICLAVCGLAGGLVLPMMARFWVVAYLVSSLFYSFHLKTRLLADVVGLSGLYVVRVMAGGAATAIVISPWTLAFCLFLFYSLALVKRFGELRMLSEEYGVPARRGYRKADLPVVAALGASSGIVSVVIFALYISSPEVRGNYCSPARLWLACPVILYWFGRIWILANRGNVAEDPLVFAFKDRISYLAGVCIAAIWLAASICR